VGQLEEVGQHGHVDGIGLLPGGEWFDALPLLLLHKVQEGIAITGSTVLPELAILNAGGDLHGLWLRSYTWW